MAPAYRLVTIALVTLTTMIAFEAMAVTTAMPRAAEQLGAVGSYGLAFSAMLTAMLLGNVLAGSWADRSGPLPGLAAGQALFVAGSVVCAAAPSWGAMLGGRVVCGLGAGLVIVTEFVAVGRVYPPAMRPRVFTWLSAAWVVPSVVGAPVAGWVTTSWSWRWVFGLVVIPAGVAAALVTARRADLIEHHGEPSPTTASADVAGHRRAARLGALVALGAGAVQLAIQQVEAQRAVAHGPGPTDGLPVWAGWAALALLGLVVTVGTVPRLLPLGALRAARGLPSVVVSRALFNGSFMATVTFLPLLLVQVFRLDLTTAGAVIAVASVGWSTGSWMQGRSRAKGPAARSRLVWLGALALTLGTVGLAHAAAVQAPVLVHAGWIGLAGLGMGYGSTTLSVLVLDLAPPDEHGQASAALQLCDVLGSVLGIAAATAIFGAAHRAGDTGVFVVIDLALAAVSALAVVTGRRCAPSRPRQRTST